MLRVARGDRHLRPLGALAFAYQLGYVLGQRLRTERRLSQHDLADRLVDDLLEARHVRALLRGAEVHVALQARVEQLLADADDLLDARYSYTRERNRDRRDARLNVLSGGLRQW